MSARAVVFAYSEVGSRCLRALYEGGVQVPLVVTHDDDPHENRWFASVAEIARAAGSRVVTPADPADPALADAVREARPDFIYSFYYRRMLPTALLALAPRGALNVHGSLLPRYRGRAPVHWAILNGETETGASLHYMVAKPDAGPLVDQERVPIGPDDDALAVSRRVAEAAERVVRRSLPLLLEGRAAATPLDLAAGSYFGGRKPADGEFQWSWPAKRIHDLVRAVAPPFPGAFAHFDARLLRVHRTRLDAAPARHAALAPCLYADGGELVAECGDAHRLLLLDSLLDDAALDAARFTARYGAGPVAAVATPVSTAQTTRE